MTTSTAPPPSPVTPPTLDRWATARLLVVLQAALLLASTIESLVAAGFAGPPALGAAGLTAIAAAITLLTAVRLGRRGRRARRWTIVAEAGLVVLAAVDVFITMVLVGGDVPLMLLATRVALPVGVIALLWRPGAVAHPEGTIGPEAAR